MSDTEIVAGPLDATTEDLQLPGLKPKYKSWRKKYRKMKVRFDDMMKDNSTMFKEEEKLELLSKRLQEQNDQLLELLVELNGSFQVPQNLRYNVSLPAPPSEYDHLGLEDTNKLLFDAHQAVQRGQYTPTEFANLRVDLETRLANSQAVSLSELERRVPHASYDPDHDDIPPHLADLAVQSGFLDSAHEDTYLLRTDAKLGEFDAMGTIRPRTPVPFADMTPRELEREVELRNPVSVHNWLKKHNVNINLDADASSEAGGPPTASKKGRNLAKKVGDKSVQQAKGREEGSPMSNVAGKETDDDMDFADDTPGSGGRNKKSRDRDDDHAYRPKGGRSGKQKRKREDGDTPSGKKKPKTSVAPGEIQ